MPRPGKKDLIITKALQMFLTKGFSNVLVDDIAAHALISKKTLYNHFPTKVDLLRACVERFTATYRQRAEKVLALPKASTIEKLEIYLQHIGETFVGSYNLLWTDLKKSAPEVWQEIVQYRREVLIEHLSDLMQSAVDSGEVRDSKQAGMFIAIFISSMESMSDADYIESLPEFIRETVPTYIPQRAAQILRLLFNGALVHESPYRLAANF